MEQYILANLKRTFGDDNKEYKTIVTNRTIIGEIYGRILEGYTRI